MTDFADLLERFRRGGELIAVVATGAAGAELDYSPKAGAWSVRQILCHLADSELVAADRFRRIIAENNPTIISYDQEAWAEKLDYHRRKVSTAIESFRRIRAENYDLLKDLPPETYARTGTHNERGTISLRELLQIMAEHAEKHAKQIQNTRQLYKASKAK